MQPRKHEDTKPRSHEDSKRNTSYMCVCAFVGAAILFTAAAPSSAQSPTRAASAVNGRRVFADYYCYACHGTEGQGGAGPRLVARATADPLIRYVRKPGGDACVLTVSEQDPSTSTRTKSIPPPAAEHSRCCNIARPCDETSPRHRDAHDALPAALAVSGAQQRLRPPDVRYVPTPQNVVEAMLEMAHVTEADVVYDLGSGDGRIPITAAQKYGARGVGIEVEPRLISIANENAAKARVTGRVWFFNQDLIETDLSPATVVTLYLLPRLNQQLMPRLKALRPGTPCRTTRHGAGVAGGTVAGHQQPDDLFVDDSTGNQPFVFACLPKLAACGERGLRFRVANACAGWAPLVPRPAASGRLLHHHAGLAHRRRREPGPATLRDRRSRDRELD